MKVEFDEFAGARLAELTRFAVVLTGDPTQAERLVVDVMRCARSHWSTVGAMGRPFRIVRAGIARAYVDGDAAVPTPEPAAEFAAMTPLQRAALVLGEYAGQTLHEISRALARPEADIDVARRGGVEALGVPAGESDVWLRDLLDDYADSIEPDTVLIEAELASRVLAADVSVAAFDAYFGAATVEVAAVPPAPAEPVHPEPVHPEPAGPIEPEPADPDPEPVGAVAEADAAGPGRPPRRRRYRSSDPSRAVQLVLLVVIALLATVLAVAIAHRTNDPSAAAPYTPAPTPSRSASRTPLPAGPLAAPIDTLLPGARQLGEFFGSGPRTVRGAVYSVAKNRELLINAVCSGSGAATIGPVSLSSCTGVPSAAVIPSRSIRSLRVQVEGSTTWRFVVSDSPEPGTNAVLTYPVSPLLTRSSLADQVASATGRGGASIPLSSAAVGARAASIRVLVSCTGGRLTLTSGDGSLGNGRITTCFDGWSYEFDLPRALLPGSLRLTAPATASWKVVVVRA